MNENISVDTLKSLIGEIYKFNYITGDPNESTLQIATSNEIRSAVYFDSTSKMLGLASNDYEDYHFAVGKRFYDAFIYRGISCNPKRMYQIVICDGYTNIIRFDKSDFVNTHKSVANFKNPGRVYSFHDSIIIIVESEYKLDFITYEDITNFI